MVFHSLVGNIAIIRRAGVSIVMFMRQHDAMQEIHDSGAQ